MKAGGIILIVVASLLLAVSGFFGFFSIHNSNAAERLSSLTARGGGFIVELVKKKAERQMTYSLGAGIPGVLGLGGGIVMVKKSRKRG